MIQYTLKVSQFTLLVNLGVLKQERDIAQKVTFDIELSWYSENAISEDSLDNSVCYDVIVSVIRSFCENKTFKTIEFLASSTYLEIKDQILSDMKLSLEVTKINPPIEELKGGASFKIND